MVLDSKENELEYIHLVQCLGCREWLINVKWGIKKKKNRVECLGKASPKNISIIRCTKKLFELYSS